jgi:hypothetical protein
VTAATKIRWGVGILTAPRSQLTVTQAITALIAAGWPPEEHTIFIDAVRSGCYRGWKSMAANLLAIHGKSDWLLMIEDDCVLSAGLREFIESTAPYNAGAWHSLYCSSGLHSKNEVGWRCVQTPRQCWGSVAYMVSPALLKKFLDNAPYPTWRDGTDRAVGQFCRASRVPYVIHSPSLANHIGEISSLDQPGGVDQNRRCSHWVSSIRRDEDGIGWRWKVAGLENRESVEAKVVIQ